VKRRLKPSLLPPLRFAPQQKTFLSLTHTHTEECFIQAKVNVLAGACKKAAHTHEELDDDEEEEDKE
jgi:hypothetical protein